MDMLGGGMMDMSGMMMYGYDPSYCLEVEEGGEGEEGGMMGYDGEGEEGGVEGAEGEEGAPHVLALMPAAAHEGGFPLA